MIKRFSMAGIAVVLASAGISRAQEPLAPARVVVVESPTQKAEPFTPSPEFQAWVTDLVREHIPHEYEKRKNWGNTDRRFDGISVAFDDGRIKTHRRFKEVNDGTWTMYRVELADPDRQFEVRVSAIEELEGGRVAMDLAAQARLDVFGRQSLWSRGIQVYSLSAEADAVVRFTAHAEVATRIDPTVLPPDVYIVPTIKTAQLEILDFRLRRLSRAGSTLVRPLSHSIRELLEEKLADDNADLVAKLNKQIAKQQGKLKVSLADVFSFVGVPP